MKILVTISGDHYERILLRVDKNSRIHSILIHAVVVYDRTTTVPRKVAKILCEKSDAEMLRDASRTICPEATAEIEQSIANPTTL